jgi:hypothetical protein
VSDDGWIICDGPEPCASCVVLRAQLEQAREALEAADYLIVCHRMVAARKTVRNLDEAEAAYTHALQALREGGEG